MIRGLVLLAVLATPVGAQEHQVFLRDDPKIPAAKSIQAVVRFFGASRRAGGYGWVTVALHNRDERAQRVALQLNSQPNVRISQNYRVRRTLALEPGMRARLFLPLAPSDGASLSFEVNGVANPRATLGDSNLIEMGGMSALQVTRRSAFGAATLANLRRRAMAAVRRSSSYTTEPLRHYQCVPDELPDRWPLLTGFDLIVLDGAAKGMSAERQELLLRYVGAGGHLLVGAAESVPDGPLARAFGDEEEGSFGFGTWFRFEGADPPTHMRAWLDRSEPERLGPMAGGGRSLSGPPLPEMHAHLEIPGLGKVPVRLFFVLILGFAILVGPINHFYFRRRRQQLRMLVTIPAVGLGFTALILLYGMFGEGFGIKGALRSLTFLDQRTHKAITYTSRTLYAGLSPESLTLEPDTYLFSIDLVGTPAFDPWSGDTGQESAHALEADLDQGVRIAGSILPSRTPTVLTTLRQGRARERLRFRRLADGRYEILHAPDFRPVDRKNSVILRDFAGDYFVSTAGGAMRKFKRSERLLLRKLWRPFHLAEDQFTQATWVDRMDQAQPWTARQWLQARFGTDLPPGSYVAEVAGVPSDADLGLGPEYRAHVAIVRGILAEEDILE